MIFLISVFMMSTAGFSLIHHVCHTCGIHKTHISMISLLENDGCMEQHDKTHGDSLCACHDGVCKTAGHEKQHRSENCSESEHEFYKIYSPFESFKYQINISLNVLELFSDLSFNTKPGFIPYSGSINRNVNPPPVLYDRDISICFSCFLI